MEHKRHPSCSEFQMPLLGSIVFEGQLLPASAFYGCFMTMSGTCSTMGNLPDNFRVMLFFSHLHAIVIRGVKYWTLRLHQSTKLISDWNLTSVEFELIRVISKTGGVINSNAKICHAFMRRLTLPFVVCRLSKLCIVPFSESRIVRCASNLRIMRLADIRTKRILSAIISHIASFCLSCLIID